MTHATSRIFRSGIVIGALVGCVAGLYLGASGQLGIVAVFHLLKDLGPVIASITAVIIAVGNERWTNRRFIKGLRKDYRLDQRASNRQQAEWAQRNFENSREKQISKKYLIEVIINLLKSSVKIMDMIDDEDLIRGGPMLIVIDELNLTRDRILNLHDNNVSLLEQHHYKPVNIGMRKIKEIITYLKLMGSHQKENFVAIELIRNAVSELIKCIEMLEEK